MNESSGAPTRGRGYGFLALQGLWISLSSALLVVLLYLALGRIGFSGSGQTFLHSLIYAASIAIPSIILLHRVSYQYSAKHPRLVILLRACVLACMAVVGCLFAGIIFQIAGIVPRGEYWSEFRSSVQFAAIIALIFGLSLALYETLRYRLQTAALELRTQQVEQERAYKLLAEARLSSLESRIHPHFLFNTLNSIASLIPKDPKQAEDIVGRLASLLRFSLNANQSSLVPLSQELKIVRDYLEIESARFGSRLHYEIAIPCSWDEVGVPPLALQSLVENSVKHVAAQRQEGANIQVVGSEESGRIQLDIRDDGPGFSLAAIPAGRGLDNLLTRLQLLFGTDGQIEVFRKDGLTTVRVSFPATLPGSGGLH